MALAKKLPDKEFLLERYKYDSDRGVLISKTNQGAGKIVGAHNGSGYLRIRILFKGKSQTFKVHRIIYFLETGKEPEIIDHIDGNRSNNHISNLREVSGIQNMGNARKMKKITSSKYKGVTRRINWKKQWTASIGRSGERKAIGCFWSEDEAAMAYDEFAEDHYGEAFALTNQKLYEDLLVNKLSFIFYSSCRGHFGFKNSYKFTIENFFKEVTMFKRFKKSCHIKYSKEEILELDKIENWLAEKDFFVVKTEGEWKHNDSLNSHAKEYYKDQLKMFTKEIGEIPEKEFSLFCEDDYLIHSDKNLSFYLKEGVDFLQKNPQALCVRINSEPNKKTEGATKINEFIYRQDEDYTPYGSTFTFQPTIVRTRDWWHSLRIINNNLHLLDSVHCEILSGQVFKQFSDDESPFYFFDPEVLWCEHIGEKEKLEKLNGITIQ